MFGFKRKKAPRAPKIPAKGKTQQEWVYVLSNQAMPGLLKIGMTTNDIETRTKQLTSATGVPYPFNVEFSLSVDDARRTERLVHEQLADYRINNRREFFKVSKRKAIRTVKACSRSRHPSRTLIGRLMLSGAGVAIISAGLYAAFQFGIFIGYIPGSLAF